MSTNATLFSLTAQFKQSKVHSEMNVMPATTSNNTPTSIANLQYCPILSVPIFESCSIIMFVSPGDNTKVSQFRYRRARKCERKLSRRRTRRKQGAGQGPQNCLRIPPNTMFE
jgi:hypothetical protein